MFRFKLGWWAFIFLHLLHGETMRANVVGSDLQNFNATTSGIDYVTVHSTETLEPQIFNTGLMFNYAVNSLPFYEEESGAQNRTQPNDTLLMAEFVFGMGLPYGFELGLSFSNLVRQQIEQNDLARSEYQGRGWTNARFNLKKNLHRRDPIGVAIMLTANRNNVRNNPYLGKNNRGIYSAELVLDAEFLGFVAAVNAGYRWRRDADKIESSFIEPTPDQYITSAALSYHLPYVDTKLISEVYASRPAESIKTNTARQASSMEALLGIKFDFRSELSVHIGGGTELLHGNFSPDWRLYTGLNYSMGTAPPPPPPPLPPVVDSEPESKEVRVRLLSTLFKTDSDELNVAAEEFLRAVAMDMENYGVVAATIEGHTDSVGAASYNMELSIRRASTVRSRLQEYLSVPIPLYIEGYGETRPVAPNTNFQGRQKNRRVEIIYTRQQ